MTIDEAQPELTSAVRSPQWYLSATRWTQLTLTEDDPSALDVDFWVDVMTRTRSNALCLSAGGYMAFYPTQIPYHYRSTHLGDRDVFGELVEAARGLDMHVMARVDPHAVHAEAAQAHPEWLDHGLDGAPVEHESMPGLWWTDPMSPSHWEFTTQIAQEIVREYDVDAVFANRWEGRRRVSYNPLTRAAFLSATGQELPVETDPSDPAWPAFTAWRRRQLSELVVHWDDAVREIRPHVRFIPNRGGALTRDLESDLVEDRYPMFFVDKQGRSGLEASWTPGRVGKRARGLYPDRPVALITSVGPEDGELRWKDSVADPHETRGLVVDGFAHGALPWFTKFKGECFDTRWVQPMADAFRLHARVEQATGHLRHTAEVALLDCVDRASATPFGQGHGGGAHEDGVYQALIEARIPFEYIAEEALTAQRLRGVRVLVIPTGADLVPATVAAIEQYVADGGGLVAGYDAGLTGGSDGSPGRLALGDLLGVRLTGGVRGPLKNKYMSLEAGHPLTAGYDGAQRILAGAHVLDIEALPDADVAFRFVPDYPDLPMEEVYPRPGPTPPAVVTRQHAGGGRTVHIAFDIGEVYWRALQSDHGRLIADSVTWALGRQPSRVSVNGQGLVDLAVREGEDEIAVTVVNLTDPMAMRGQRHDALPLHDQEVVLTIPDGAELGTADLVIAGGPARTEERDGRLHIPLETVDDLEVVHVTWTPTRTDAVQHGGQA
ncbi:family 10 glycosylhydrolase [Brachybacterium sp. GCM10030268]|uniref:family 10 glycosylhydrolase n=1 Tax=Brachybacterium sp. GCM10030268 TaxID=3273382 RepID=UPI003613FE65